MVPIFERGGSDPGFLQGYGQKICLKSAILNFHVEIYNKQPEKHQVSFLSNHKSYPYIIFNPYLLLTDPDPSNLTPPDPQRYLAQPDLADLSHGLAPDMELSHVDTAAAAVLQPGSLATANSVSSYIGVKYSLVLLGGGGVAS